VAVAKLNKLDEGATDGRRARRESPLLQNRSRPLVVLHQFHFNAVGFRLCEIRKNKRVTGVTLWSYWLSG